MDFGHDERTRELCAQLQSFMDSHIYPAEPVYREQAAKAAQEGDPWHRPAASCWGRRCCSARASSSATK